MKKLLACAALFTAVCLLFGGCSPAPDKEDGLTDENGKVEIEVKGEFCSLEVAYDNGWINEDDLKSIACSYNDFQQKENPYSGMYVQPAEELSNDVENEVKQAYLNQIAKYPDGLLENVHINYYYGTYNENIVVRIYSEYICIDPLIKNEVYIGNVVFKSWWDAQTWVYHIG